MLGRSKSVFDVSSTCTSALVLLLSKQCGGIATDPGRVNTGNLESVAEGTGARGLVTKVLIVGVS